VLSLEAGERGCFFVVSTEVPDNVARALSGQLPASTCGPLTSGKRICRARIAAPGAETSSARLLEVINNTPKP
jgi:hypothetical protein